jgi:pimeloyl-ACP methyl ester carboxylesterase
MAACAVLLAGCTGPGEDGGSAGETVTAGELTWSPCEAGTLNGLQCSTLAVPLDPDEADGETIELALARRPAGDEEARIGALVVNPGGPGASGLELVPQLASVMDRSVLDRFDLVGFDPRGVGQSAGVHCIDEPERVHQLDGDPDSTEEVRQLLDTQAAIRAACEQRHGELLVHLSTANAAHDLDRIRHALGDEQLTYLGFSYGTELGAVYASLYPGNIRALVLDGAVGPDLSEVDLALTQAEGFERSFANFADGCRQDERCAARPDARRTYESVRAAVEAAPIPVSTEGEERDLAVGDFQTGVVSALYDQALWAYLARGLVEADAGDGATMLALADLYHQRQPDGSYPNADDAHIAISCADSDTRLEPATATDRAATRAADYAVSAPLFGPQLAWSTLSCLGWPLAAEPKPPVATTTGAPIVVVGTVNDPATPYEWAGQLRDALQPAARLVTWEGEGHTAYLKSDCVTERIDAFLVELRQPDDGTRCPADAEDRAQAFAGLAPDLAEVFRDQVGLGEREAECVSRKVADRITATDLVTIYAGDLPPDVAASIGQAVAECADGG